MALDIEIFSRKSSPLSSITFLQRDRSLQGEKKLHFRPRCLSIQQTCKKKPSPTVLVLCIVVKVFESEICNHGGGKLKQSKFKIKTSESASTRTISQCAGSPLVKYCVYTAVISLVKQWDIFFLSVPTTLDKYVQEKNDEVM